MADFNEIGTNIFVMLICVNLFVVAFAHHALPTEYLPFVRDGNVTTTSIVNPAITPSVGSYAVPAQTQLNNQNSPFSGFISGSSALFSGLINSALFGLTNTCQEYGCPQEIMFGLLIPLNILEVIYVAFFLGQTAVGLLRGVFGL